MQKLSNLETLSLAGFQSNFRFWPDSDKILINTNKTDKYGQNID